VIPTVGNATPAIIPDLFSRRTDLRPDRRSAGPQNLRDGFSRKTFHVAQQNRRALFMWQRCDCLRDQLAALPRQKYLFSIVLRTRDV